MSDELNPYDVAAMRRAAKKRPSQGYSAVPLQGKQEAEVERAREWLRAWYEHMKADDPHHFAEHEEHDRGGDFPTTHCEYTFELFSESPMAKSALATVSTYARSLTQRVAELEKGLNEIVPLFCELVNEYHLTGDDGLIAEVDENCHLCQALMRARLLTKDGEIEGRG